MLSPISLGYFPPATDLRSHISYYYVFRANVPRISDVMRADVAQLRFMIGGQGHYSFGNGLTLPTPDVCLVGPTTAATRFTVEGPVLVFGMGILPAGWARMVRDDAASHADRVEDAVAMFGPPLADALNRMREARTEPELFDIADRTMRWLSRRAGEPPLWFTQLTDSWLTGQANPSVDWLVAESGLSARHVERLARRFYGAPPKLLARKYRALRAASLLGAGERPWSDPLNQPFYDQSHLIREFKRFTGLTPGQLERSPPPIARLSRQRRALAGLAPEIAVVS
ncbi:MAG TPA: AraC family transcriptional regulator [Sphingomonadaceae bacterium]|nr:AraC family transcriptional regulator [Sphingomonadaceae bacterium]